MARMCLLSSDIGLYITFKVAVWLRPNSNHWSTYLLQVRSGSYWYEWRFSRASFTSTPSYYSTNHPHQLSLAIHPWVGVLSTSESWVVIRHSDVDSPLSVASQSECISWCRRAIEKISTAPFGPMWLWKDLFYTLGVIGVGMRRSRAEVQIWEIIASDFIRDTDYCENKTITHIARTLSVGLSYNI